MKNFKLKHHMDEFIHSKDRKSFILNSKLLESFLYSENIRVFRDYNGHIHIIISPNDKICYKNGSVLANHLNSLDVSRLYYYCTTFLDFNDNTSVFWNRHLYTIKLQLAQRY